MEPENNIEFASCHHLLYWQMRSVEEHAQSGAPLDIVGSNQLAGVNTGDTIWIVTLSEEREMILCGRLLVGEVVGYEEAKKRTGDPRLWQAEYYALPAEGSEEPFFFINFEGLADSLKFAGSGQDHFITEDGKLNPQQLTEIRTLTFESAEMLTVIWKRMTAGENFEEPDPEAALAYFSQAVELDPEDPVAHYNLGVVLGQLGRIEDAAKEFEETVRIDPRSFEALYNLGATYIELGDSARAIDRLNSAILLNYDFAPSHFMLGKAYGQAGQHEQAIEATMKGLEVDPEDPGAYFNIGLSNYFLGRYEESNTQFAKAIDLAPDSSQTYFFTGRNWRMMGNRRREIENYKIALDLDPQFIDAYLALGAAHALEMGEPASNVEYIETGGSLDLHDPNQGFYLGMAFLALGDRKIPEDQAGMLDEKSPELADKLRRYMNGV